MFRGKVVFLGPNRWVLKCSGPNWYYHKLQGRFAEFALFLLRGFLSDELLLIGKNFIYNLL